MGIFGKHMLKVIEWKDETKNTIVYRYDVNDRYAIMKGSQLIVRESQAAVFVYEGKICDIFSAGRYVLDTNNLPILTKILNWKYAFENPYVGEIYYVNMKQFMALKWGTSNPIMMRDKDFGMIRLRGYGIYSFKVKEPDVFMREVLGTIKSYKTEDIHENLKKQILQSMTDTIAEAKIPALDLAMNYQELSEMAKRTVGAKFTNIGLELTDIAVENLSLPEEVEKMLDKRTSMGVIGDQMGTYTQFQAAEAMRDAAKNPGGLSGAGIGIGAGIGLGNLMGQTLGQSMNGMNNNNNNGGGNTVKVKCPKCGALVKENAKFCPECGEKMGTEICPKCGAKVKAGAKFCPECGVKLGEQVCSKCGAKVKAGAKFCPECGEKL